MHLYHFYKIRKKFVYVFFIILISLTNVQSALYSFGSDNGDTVLELANWSTGSTRIVLESPVRLFGTNLVSEIWINSFGSISLNATTNDDITKVQRNVVLAPFFSRSLQGPVGAIYYKQLQGKDDVLSAISRDVTNFEDNGQVFTPTFALTVTWDRVASPDDLTKMNTFQLNLVTNSMKTFLIFNYAPITWTSSMGKYAEAGVRASGTRTEHCSQYLSGSGTAQIMQLSSISNTVAARGRFVIDVTNPLDCTSSFQSSCEKFPGQGRFFRRGVLTPQYEMNLNEDVQNNFYLNFTCKPGLVISPKMASEKIRCLYDSDYYDFTWIPSEVSRCIDINATSQCQITVELNTTSRMDFNNDREISQLMKNINISDIIVGDITTTRSNQSETNLVIFTTFSPAFVNRRLCNETLKRRLRLQLNNTKITTDDVTDPCMQVCLCRNRRDPILCRGNGRPMVPPDACCGKCGGVQRPYATSLKACCNNSKIYDPTISVCCPGGVRRGDTCPK